MKYIFWLGAGVSIPSPTSLKDGKTYTLEWLEYLLEKNDFKFISDLFSENSELIGKDCPRLEKVIEDAIKVYGSDVLNLLLTFKDRPTNINHILLSKYIVENKSLAFTTNFDDCIEKASINAIPIHLPNNDCTDTWGLVKLHDSILNPSLELLGHSIKNLVNGISIGLEQMLIDCLNEKGNTFVFCGYSGQDFFDIIPFFSNYSDNQKFEANIIWIDHSNNVPKDGKSLEQLERGPRTIIGAFSNYKVVSGNTTEILEGLCGYSKENYKTINAEFDFSPENAFLPPKKLKKLFASQLFATFGYGAKSFEAVILSHVRNRESLYLLLNSIRDSGYYKTEVKLRKQIPVESLSSKENWFDFRQLAAAYRLNGSRFLSFVIYYKLYKHSKIPHDDPAIIEEQLWSLAEYGLFINDYISKIPDIYFAKINIGKIPRIILGGYVRTLYDLCYSKYRNHMKSPHLIATLDRLLNMLSSLAGGGSSVGYYRRALNDKIVADTSSIAIANFMDAESLYLETDSILGKINNLRGQAVNLLYQSRDKKIKMEDNVRKSMRDASLLFTERSYQLSKLIGNYSAFVSVS